MRAVFLKGEYVVSGSKGVCVVEDVATLDISGVDNQREYYVLKPVYMSSSTVYVPVDHADESVRKVLSKEEAREFIGELPSIPMIEIDNDKALEQEYKGCMKSNCCREWARIIKTIYSRTAKRLAAGRKVTTVDARYSRMAQDKLYGELAVSLGLDREMVEEYICGVIDSQAVSGC
ncbi:MAG: CarD family transcriptional regulator [Lachnospiraceae bacterium]|nr:CarD family transcriptional regulator [Lachnospiraceae bacterium]